MTRLVRVKGESDYEHVLDLDRNPWAEDQIAAEKLTVVEELDKLPADPWAKKKGPTTPANPDKEA